MANLDNPTGFKPLNMAGTRPPQKYKIEGAAGTPYASNLFIGDAVVLASGYLTVATAGTANQILGVIVGFESDGDFDYGYYPASSGDEWYALVADDPNQYFTCQDDGQGTPAIGNIGASVNLIAGSGNTTTNLSGHEVDSSAFDGAVTDQFRIIGFVDKPGNALGAANVDLIVAIHNHQLRQENNVDAVT